MLFACLVSIAPVAFGEAALFLLFLVFVIIVPAVDMLGREPPVHSWGRGGR